MEFFNNKKGRAGLKSIIMTFVWLLLYVVFLPTIQALLTDVAPYFAGNTMGLWLVSLIPLAILLGIFMAALGLSEAQ